MTPEDREKARRVLAATSITGVGAGGDKVAIERRAWEAARDLAQAVLAALSLAEPAPVEITDEQREQIVVAIQDHVMPRLARPTSAEAGALRETVNRALSMALSQPAVPPEFPTLPGVGS